MTAAAAQDVDHTELTMEETSKQSPEAKNWPVILYNQASFPQVPIQGEDLSAQDVDPSKERALLSDMDPYPALPRRRSTGFSSVGNRTVTLYRGLKAKTDDGIRPRVISRHRGRVVLDGPSEYGKDASNHGRENRSDRYVSRRYYQKPSRLRDHTIKWTDKVAKSETVTNETLFRRNRGTSVFTLENLSDNETSITNSDEESSDASPSASLFYFRPTC